MAYIAPIHRPSSVRHARRVRLFSDEEESIAIAKANRIEIWRFTETDELRLFHSQLVYGTVSMLEVLRPKDASDRELLFVGTDRFDYCTLAWDAERRRLQTVDNYRDPGEKHLRASQSQDRSVVDPTGRYVALLLWEGVLSVLRMKPRRGDRARGSSLEWMSQVRLSELFVKACTFLYSETGHPKIAFLYQSQTDHRDARLATYRVTSDDRDAVVAPFDPERDRDISLDVDDPGAAMLIPVASADVVKRHYVRKTAASKPHLGGLLVVGETRLLYIDDATQATTEVALRTPAVFVAWARYDATHYFLADDDGVLRLLTILTDDGDGTTVTSLDVHTIGNTSRASSLVYVEARRMLFVGSHNGDSQLFRINLNAGRPEGEGQGQGESEGKDKAVAGAERGDDAGDRDGGKPKRPTYCELVQVMDNLAPIFDFAIMDMGSREDDAPLAHAYASGQARLVTGSGVHKDGSLRSVRSGVGLEDVGILTAFDDSVRALFPLRTRAATSPTRADTLVVSLLTETRVFVFDDDGGIEEVDRVAGLDLGVETLWAANLPADLPGACGGGGKVLQVTPRAVRVVDVRSGVEVCAWRPSDGDTGGDAEEITSVSANARWVLLAVGGKRLVSLSLARGLVEAAATTFGADQIACLHAAPQLLDTGVVGLWQDGTITLVDLATLQPTQASAPLRHKDDNASVPRAIVLAQVLPRDVAGPSLFVSMDDGTVVAFGVAESEGAAAVGGARLGSRKRVVLGTRHANLHLLPQADGATYNVFATTDHPSLIYGSEGRIVYAAVTATDAHVVCAFDAEAFPGTVAVATATEVKLARPDTQKQTHVLGIPMGANVRRLAYSPAERVFALGCIARKLVRGREVVTSSVRLVDEILFQPLGDALVLDADRHELIECVVRATLPDAQGQPAERFLVGTSYLAPTTATATATAAVASSSSSRAGGGGGGGDPSSLAMPPLALQASTSAAARDDPGCLGRLLVVAVDHQRGPYLVAAHRLLGPCRCLGVVDDELIVLGLSKTVVVARHVETSDLSGTMRKVAAYRTGTYVVDLAVQGRLIAVGDLTRSTALVEYVPPQPVPVAAPVHVGAKRRGAGGEPVAVAAPAPAEAEAEVRMTDAALVPRARNYEASWVTAVCPLEGNSWLEADAQGNLTVLWRNVDGVTEQDRGRLRVTSEMNLGETVNRIRPIAVEGASAAADTPMADATTTATSTAMVQPQAFLATAEGAIYVFGTVAPHAQDLLMQLQGRLAQVLTGLGNTPFLAYRGFRNMVREAAGPLRFVDGEMLERFLDLDETLQKEVAEGLGPSVEDLRNSIEELKQLH